MTVLPFERKIEGNDNTSILQASPEAVALLRDANRQVVEAQALLRERFTMFCAMHGIVSASLIDLTDTSVKVQRGP